MFGLTDALMRATTRKVLLEDIEKFLNEVADEYFEEEFTAQEIENLATQYLDDVEYYIHSEEQSIQDLETILKNRPKLVLGDGDNLKELDKIFHDVDFQIDKMAREMEVAE